MMNVRRLVLLILVLGLLLVTGIIPDAPILRAVTASYQETVRIVDSTGTVISGVASATSANYNETIRVVDSTGKVLDSFGGGASLTAGTGIGISGNTVSTSTVPTNYINLVTDEGAKCLGIDVFDGAMDNNSTATVTSASAQFTAAMATRGDLVCVEGSSSTGQTCGTVVTFTNSSHIVVSFKNTSGGAITGKEVGIVTNDSSALTAALLLNSTTGRPIAEPAGYCGFNTNLTVGTAYSLLVQGGGNGTTNSSDGAPGQALAGSTLWAMTTSMTGPAIAINNPANTNNDRTNVTINDLAIRAGVGSAGDGGGSGVQGIESLNWHGLQLNRVTVSNFNGSNIYVDTQSGSSSTNTVYGIDFENVTSMNSGADGFRLGTTSAAGYKGNVQFQDIHIGTNSQAIDNFGYGINFASDCYTCSVDTDSLAQNNNRALGGTGFAEINLGGGGAGSKIDNMYIETDQVNTDGIENNAGAQIIGWAITNNFLIDTTTGGTGILLGGSHEFGPGGVVTNNFIEGYATASLTVGSGGVDPQVQIQNNYNGTINIYGSNANNLFGGATAFLPEFTGNNALYTLELVGPQTASPRNVVMNSQEVTNANYVGAYDISTNATAQTDKRVAEIAAYLTASGTTTLTGDLLFLTANGGAVGQVMTLSAAGGLYVGSTITDAGAGNIQAKNNLITTTGTVTSTTGAIGPTAGGILQSYGGTLPTCACTGGSPTCTAQTGASNSAGELDVTGGTAMTTCTLTFSSSGAFHAAPICIFVDKNASATPLGYSTGAESTSTVVFDFASATAFDVNYICVGH